ncbi:uncharacterized protein LOC144115114 isoform X2 [Amblyomma americanum]
MQDNWKLGGIGDTQPVRASWMCAPTACPSPQASTGNLSALASIICSKLQRGFRLQ